MDEALDILVLADIALVGLDLDAVLLRQFRRVLLGAVLAGGIGDGQVGAHLGAATGGFDAHATRAGSASDGDDLALEAEELEQAVGLGNRLRHDGRWFVGRNGPGVAVKEGDEDGDGRRRERWRSEEGWCEKPREGWKLMKED